MDVRKVQNAKIKMKNYNAKSRMPDGCIRRSYQRVLKNDISAPLPH
jgi:hypothetical protein